jgi:hypothetical protein
LVKLTDNYHIHALRWLCFMPLVDKGMREFLYTLGAHSVYQTSESLLT